jgi:hypothetical protein
MFQFLHPGRLLVPNTSGGLTAPPAVVLTA